MSAGVRVILRIGRGCKIHAQPGSPSSFAYWKAQPHFLCCRPGHQGCHRGLSVPTMEQRVAMFPRPPAGSHRPQEGLLSPSVAGSHHAKGSRGLLHTLRKAVSTVYGHVTKLSPGPFLHGKVVGLGQSASLQCCRLRGREQGRGAEIMS